MAGCRGAGATAVGDCTQSGADRGGDPGSQIVPMICVSSDDLKIVREKGECTAENISKRSTSQRRIWGKPANARSILPFPL